MVRRTLLLVALVAALLGAPGPCFADAAPLERGRDVEIVIPRDKSSFLLAPKDHPVALEILQCEPFAQAVRDYHHLSKAKHPLYVVLLDQHDRVAFFTSRPMVTFASKDALLPDRVALLAPAIHLNHKDMVLLDLAYRQRKDGTLDPKRPWNRGHETLCHEAGHAIMYGSLDGSVLDLPAERLARLAAAGLSPENGISGLKREGHWVKKRTDPGFAFSEGFAIYTGAYYTGLPINIDLTTLQPSDIRRCEGAQAKLMLAIANELPGEGHRTLIDTLKAKRPTTFMDLALDVTETSQENAIAVHRALRKASEDRFELPTRYTWEDYLDDARPNAERLGELIIERTVETAERIQHEIERFQRRRSGEQDGPPAQ